MFGIPFLFVSLNNLPCNIMAGLVEIFTDYAAAQGWKSAYVTLESKEWQTSQQNLTGGEYMMYVFPFKEKPVMHKAGFISHWTASTMIWLGRKFDNTSTTGTKSSIDETPNQKEARRMQTIRVLIRTMIKDLFCAGDYEMTAATMHAEFNVSSESMDFVIVDVTFKNESGV
jgi:hypothetical protein